MQSSAEPVQWPLRAARAYRLPAAPSTLLGRERDAQAVTELVLGEKSRLLTLVGPPGVGKTRLGLAVADRLQDHFAHGAAFVELASLRVHHLVLETVAQTFGLRQQGSLSPAEQLPDYLGEMSVLLVLDNFEHLAEASAELARLLTSAPRLVILATSRAAPRIRWERLYEVEPLAADASVDVFVERARATRADFAISDAEVPIVQEICARLDHLPLAIELVAGRSVLLSPAEILDRLSRRLVLLSDAPRDASTRHRTMRDAIDWSYELLASDERALLGRLSCVRWRIHARGRRSRRRVFGLPRRGPGQPRAHEPRPPGACFRAPSPIAFPPARNSASTPGRSYSQLAKRRLPSGPMPSGGGTTSRTTIP